MGIRLCLDRSGDASDMWTVCVQCHLSAGNQLVGQSGRRCPVPKSRSHGQGGLFKRSDGMWTGTVEIPTADGKRRTKRVYSKNRNEAARKLRELRAEIAAGRVPTTSTTTVGKWLDHWLESVAKPELRPTTYRSYEQVLRLHVKPHIGGIRLNKLTA